jgi:hypothetical protein
VQRTAPHAMTRRMKYWIALLPVLFATVSYAQSGPGVSVYGRGYTDACQYYSRTEADLEISYRDEGLPWGTRVFVVHGFGEEGSDWSDRAEIEAKAVGPYTWRAQVSKTLHFRSSQSRIESMQFVVRAVLPDGSEQYYRGGESTMGFFNTALPFAGSSPCLPSTGAKPAFTKLALRVVERI